MTWSRYSAIHAHREHHPSLKHLLTVIAAQNGYAPPKPPKSGAEAAAEFMGMFPGGTIRGPGSG